jgi:PAS domain S-box-containing protein
MKGEDKTEKQLIHELKALRQRIAELEKEKFEPVPFAEAFPRSGEEYRSIFENTPFGIFRSTLDGKLLGVNPKFAQMLGYGSPEEMISVMNQISIGQTPYFDPEFMSEIAKNTLESGGGWIEAESHRFRRDGEKITVRLLFRKTPGEAGKPDLLEGFVEDITARKHAEEALQASQQRYKQLLSSVTDYMFTIEIEDGRPVSTTHGHGCVAVTGYTPADYARMPLLWYEMIHPEDRQVVKHHAEISIRGEAKDPLEHRIIHRDGTTRWVRNTMVPRYDSLGRVVACDGLVSNITERKQAEEALRVSEEKYRLVVESAGEAIVIAQDGMIKFVNPSALDLLGHSEELVMSKPFMEFVHTRDREMVIDRHTRRLKGEEPPRIYPFRVVTRDGTVKWVELSTVAVLWDERLATLNFLADITKRKLAEDELSRYRDHLEDLVKERAANLIRLNEQLKMEIGERRAAEQKYRSIFENALEGIYQSSPEGRYLEANPAFARMFGYDSPEELKHAVQDIGHQLYLEPKIREESMRVLQEQGSAVFEVQFRRKDGSTGWVSNNVRAIRDREGKIIRFEGVAEDITERKRAEEELRRARDELEDRVEERTAELRIVNDQLLREIAEHKHTQEALMESEKQLRFLSFRLLEAQEEERKRIAIELHDSIGQSLAAVKFSVENFLQGGSIGNSEVLAKQLEILVPMIQGAIEEARRIYTGLRPSMLDDLGIHATVNWFCREFQKTFPCIRLHEQMEVEEAEIPEAIKIVIFRVLQEALNNVAKYSEAEWVKVKLSKTASNIELSIKDNGRGFDFQEAVSKNAHEKGFGLTGMKERTELSGGAFSVKSKIGRGTSIRASWPCKT